MTTSDRDSWYRELGLPSQQIYAPFKAPKAPEEDLIRAYLNRDLDSEREIEVQTLVVTYREWADALSQIIREEFAAMNPAASSTSSQKEDGATWLSATEQSSFEDYLQQEPDELLGLLITTGSTTRAGGNPIRPYLSLVREYLKGKLVWNERRDAILALSERERAQLIIEALREEPRLTPFENLVALGTWLVKYGLDRILDTGD